MEIKWLEDFLSLADNGNFTTAADERYISQSAFSRRIKNLEFVFGAELFDRNTFPVQLSEEGKILRPVVEHILRLYYDAKQDLQLSGRSSPTRIRFAALHTLASSFFPKWFIKFRKDITDATASMKALDLIEGIATLEQRSCDFFLCYGHATVPVLLDSSNYSYCVLSDDILIPVSKTDDNQQPLHEFSIHNRQAPNILAYSPNCLLGKVVEDIWWRNEINLNQKIIYESSMSEALRAMTVAGQGISWLPKSLIENELDNQTLVQIGPENFSTKLEIRLYTYKGNHKEIANKVWQHSQ